MAARRSASNVASSSGSSSSPWSAMSLPSESASWAPSAAAPAGAAQRTAAVRGGVSDTCHAMAALANHAGAGISGCGAACVLLDSVWMEGSPSAAAHAALTSGGSHVVIIPRPPRRAVPTCLPLQVSSSGELRCICQHSVAQPAGGGRTQLLPTTRNFAAWHWLLPRCCGTTSLLSLAHAHLRSRHTKSHALATAGRRSKATKAASLLTTKGVGRRRSSTAGWGSAAQAVKHAAAWAGIGSSCRTTCRRTCNHQLGSHGGRGPPEHIAGFTHRRSEARPALRPAAHAGLDRSVTVVLCRLTTPPRSRSQVRHDRLILHRT